MSADENKFLVKRIGGKNPDFEFYNFDLAFSNNNVYNLIMSRKVPVSGNRTVVRTG